MPRRPPGPSRPRERHGPAAQVSNLKNTIDETEWLPERAVTLGALTASAFGAGFGGSCYAIVSADAAEAFAAAWEGAYREQFPSRRGACSFFVMSPGPGACCI